MDIICDETDLQGILGGMDDFYETQRDVLSEIGYMEHENAMNFETTGEQKEHLINYQIGINSDPNYANSLEENKGFEIKRSPASDHGQHLVYSPILHSLTGSLLGEQLTEMQTSAFLSQVSTTGLPVGPFVIPQEFPVTANPITIVHSPRSEENVFQQDFQENQLEAHQMLRENSSGSDLQFSPRQDSSNDLAVQESGDGNNDLNGDGSNSNDGFQFIRFQAFQPGSWRALYDQSFKKLQMLQFRIDADKGFNFSSVDDGFICQKKNHFQLTCLIHMNGEPHYIQTGDGVKKIDRFILNFFGVKAESLTEVIHLEQSQSDRSKKPFRPIHLDLRSQNISKTTVGRLHFSETTANNMRKKGKPNPDQRFFYLVASLKAQCDGQEFTAIAYSSERIIVRASNPGMFESETPQVWQKGSSNDTVVHHGRVGINTDHPEEALVVHGNLRVTGRLVQPSDLRAKETIREADTREQLKNVQALRVVHFKYTDEFAKTAGLKDHERSDTGVIAQEVETIIPDAVRPAGSIVLPSGKELDSFLLVNKERIFMENVGAVKELCKVTDKLETRIDELERMNSKLWMIKRLDNIRSSFNSTCSLTFKKKQRSACSSVSDNIGAQRPSCNNRFLRASVAILVSIMAMCLIAMATLYVLEWQKRPMDDVFRPSSQNSFEFEHHTLLNYSDPSIEDYLYGSDKSLSQMSGIMTEAPNASDFQTNTQTTQKSNIIILPTTPREIIFTAKPATVETNLTYNAPQSYTSLTSIKPSPIGKPNTCSAITTCQFYCCKPGSRMSNEVESYNSTAGTGSRQVNEATPESVFKEYTKEAKGYGSRGPQYDSNSYFMVTRFGSLVSGKKNKRILQRTRRHLNSQRPQSRASFGIDTITGRAQQQSTPTANPPVRDWNGRADGISLIGSNFNVTIGPNYCMSESDQYIGCLNGDATNYTYGIPISKYMPDRSLTLLFNFTTTISLQPDICPSPSRFSVCPDGSTDQTGVNSIQRGLVLSLADTVARTFFVDVGRTSVVAYRLRFPMARGDTTDFCNLADLSAGEKFIEYNFIFHRVCDD